MNNDIYLESGLVHCRRFEKGGGNKKHDFEHVHSFGSTRISGESQYISNQPTSQKKATRDTRYGHTEKEVILSLGLAPPGAPFFFFKKSLFPMELTDENSIYFYFYVHSVCGVAESPAGVLCNRRLFGVCELVVLTRIPNCCSFPFPFQPYGIYLSYHSPATR